MNRATTGVTGCCISCGRDARGSSGFCSSCQPRSGPSDMRGRKALPPRLEELEDDYGDESDADSVCEDQGV